MSNAQILSPVKINLLGFCCQHIVAIRIRR
jgi:hypothetical protein